MNRLSGRIGFNVWGVLLFFIGGLGTLCCQTPSDPLIGDWAGLLDTGRTKLHLALQVKVLDGGRLQAKMISLDQGAAEIPVSRVDRQGDKVSLDMPLIQGGFEGTLDATGGELSGEFRQGPARFPLTFRKSAAPAEVKRPQDPVKPYPYRVEDVTVENAAAGLKLAGTLTLPPGPGPFPGVVLITGSGLQDRDETIFGHHPFWVLADFLTRRGLAVLRLDDRGCGGSEGDPRLATTADFATDTLAGVRFLAGRSEVNSKRIGLIGHSEGGLIAEKIAADNPAEIAFIVLMAGPGVTGERILLRQGEQIGQAGGATPAEIAQNRKVQEDLFALIKAGLPPQEIRQQAGDIIRNALDASPKTAGLPPEKRQAIIEQQVAAILSPWMRYFISADPAPLLAKVKCPVLALNGAKDLQVDATENLPAIAKALREGGNQDVTTLCLPGLNHLFQQCSTGLVDEYGTIEETLNPKFLEALGAWLDREGLTGAPGGASRSH
jgi:pimeloyl-ACP methyl ester carboxylesterase